jgi:hypothetical protein
VHWVGFIVCDLLGLSPLSTLIAGLLVGLFASGSDMTASRNTEAS